MEWKKTQWIFYLKKCPVLEKLCQMSATMKNDRDIRMEKNEQEQLCWNTQPHIFKSRELLFSDENILITPSSFNDYCFKIIMNINYYLTGNIQKRLFAMGWQINHGAPQRVSAAELQTALRYAIDAKLAPLWNKAGEYLIEGLDYLTSSDRCNAIKYSVIVSDTDIYFVICPCCIRIPKFKLEQLNVRPSVVHDFNFSNDEQKVIPTYEIANKWAHVLPSLKRGQVMCISKKMPLCDIFSCYNDMKAYWKSMHGYVLPEDEKDVLFGQIFFKGLGSQLFSYPLCCIKIGGCIELFQPDKKAVLVNFLKSLILQVPNVLDAQLELDVSPQGQSRNVPEGRKNQVDLQRQVFVSESDHGAPNSTVEHTIYVGPSCAVGEGKKEQNLYVPSQFDGSRERVEKYENFKSTAGKFDIPVVNRIPILKNVERNQIKVKDQIVQFSSGDGTCMPSNSGSVKMICSTKMQGVPQRTQNVDHRQMSVNEASQKLYRQQLSVPENGTCLPGRKELQGTNVAEEKQPASRRSLQSSDEGEVELSAVARPVQGLGPAEPNLPTASVNIASGLESSAQGGLCPPSLPSSSSVDQKNMAFLNANGLLVPRFTAASSISRNSNPTNYLFSCTKGVCQLGIESDVIKKNTNCLSNPVLGKRKPAETEPYHSHRFVPKLLKSDGYAAEDGKEGPCSSEKLATAFLMKNEMNCSSAMNGLSEKRKPRCGLLERKSKSYRCNDVSESDGNKGDDEYVEIDESDDQSASSVRLINKHRTCQQNARMQMEMESKWNGRGHASNEAERSHSNGGTLVCREIEKVPHLYRKVEECESSAGPSRRHSQSNIFLPSCSNNLKRQISNNFASDRKRQQSGHGTNERQWSHKKQFVPPAIYRTNEDGSGKPLGMDGNDKEIYRATFVHQRASSGDGEHGKSDENNEFVVHCRGRQLGHILSRSRGLHNRNEDVEE